MIRRKLLDSKGSDALPLAIVRRFGLAGIAVAIVLLAGCARPRVVIAPSPPAARIGYEETGLASWYGNPYHGRRAASGEVYDMMEMTAAHQTLPFNTWLIVENLNNHRTAEVRVNDRGPFVDKRILDLSYAAARPWRNRAGCDPRAFARDQWVDACTDVAGACLHGPGGSVQCSGESGDAPA